MIIQFIIALNWLCKHSKKVRGNQPAILVLNWIKHSFFPVSIVKLDFFVMYSWKYITIIEIYRNFIRYFWLDYFLEKWSNKEKLWNNELFPAFAKNDADGRWYTDMSLTSALQKSNIFLQMFKVFKANVILQINSFTDL